MITFVDRLNSMTFITNKIKLIKFMKKKEYERPSTRVIELKHQTHLLQTSGQVQATMNTEWEEEDF